MKTEEKFTLGEAALVFVLAAVVIIGVSVAVIPLMLLLTYIRIQLWNWFAVPYLHLPTIPFWVMYGLTLLIGTFYSTHAPTSDYKPTWKQHLNTMLSNVGGWLLAWGFGYGVHHWLVR